MKAARPIHVLLVVPRARDGRGLASVLRRGGAHVRVRTREAVAAGTAGGAAGRRPDVVVLDAGSEGALTIPLPLEAGAPLETTPRVILVDQADSELAAHAIRAGARAVVPRQARAAEIVAAVHAAAAGLTALPAAWAGAAFRLGGPDLPHPAADGVRGHALTPREGEILALLGEGLGNKQVAARLGISDHTVKTHLVAIYDKLGAANRAEAVATGLRRGLIML